MTMGAGPEDLLPVHLPVAINTFLACLVVFIASVGYLMAASYVVG